MKRFGFEKHWLRFSYQVVQAREYLAKRSELLFLSDPHRNPSPFLSHRKPIHRLLL
ncbi:hypothetical protein ACLOJK_000033 [Asimina triloba]